MSNNWSWACVATSQNRSEPDTITKANLNLSTCPTTLETGQVDRSITPIDMQRQPPVVPNFNRDAFVERAAIIEANGIRHAWAEGFAMLCTMPRPSAYTPERWQQIVNDGGRFLDRWGREAAALHWQADDVFGVNPNAPEHDYHWMGLVPLLQGRSVIVITYDTARIDCGSKIYQTFYRKTMSPGAVAVWCNNK